MKKYRYILAALALAAVSCTKADVQDVNDKKQDTPDGGGSLEMVFGASSEPGTKTAIGELNEGVRPITWVKDDEIKLFYNSSSTTSKAQSDGATTTFSVAVEEAPAYYAVYPSSAESSLSEGTVTVTIPAKPDATKGFGTVHYAAAVAVGNNFAFKNLCGFLKFSIKNSEIRSIIIRGAGEQALAGKVSVSFDESGKLSGDPVISSGNSRIIVSVNGAGEYYVPIVPGANLENGVGFRFYREGEITAANAIETGVFCATPLSVSRSGIVNLGCLDERIASERYIAPTAQGTGDGLSAANAAAGVEYLRQVLAQDATSDKTKNGVAKGYGCIGVTIHAAAGEYDFAGEEITVAWPGHTSAIGTTIEGVEGTIFKNTKSSRFFKVGAQAELTFRSITFKGGNVASAANGGALLINGESARVKCDDCVFDGNSAALGGAVYVNYTSASAWFNSCVFISNEATAATAVGRAVVTAAGSSTCFNNCTFGEQKTATACYGDIDIRGGSLVFANSTMIAKSTGGLLRVHTSGGDAAFINSIVVNATASVKSINYNSTSGTLTSKYVISGTPQNKYKADADTDKSGVTLTDLGSPELDVSLLVYKWDGTLTAYTARASTADAGSLINTANEDFYNWLSELGALTVDQCGNSRATDNRQGSWCGK